MTRVGTDEDSAGIIRRHWNSVASAWRHFGPPLRPCNEDIEIFRGFAAKYSGASASEALLLGVTPEIASMEWPRPCRLTAIDRSAEMVQVVWPGDVSDRRRAFVCEWLSAPSAPKGYGVVIGDGCFISTAYPDGHRALGRRVRHLLAPDGMFLMRFFMQLQEPEHPEDVLDDLAHGRIGSFHAFKWRFAMSIQKSAGDGVRLHDIWAAWRHAKVDPESLPTGPGWTSEGISTIDLYRDKEARFAFAHPGEIEAILQEDFEVVERRVPGYELGERCPILALRPRGQ